MKIRQSEQVEFTFEMTKVKRRKKSYRERMLEAFDRDPLRCPCCKQRMLLVVVWHADYADL